MAGDMDYLPLDIISLILLWLPTPSLLRFKSVSKSWLSLIQSSNFVYKHIRLASLTNADLIVLTCPYSDDLYTPPQQQHISLLRGDTQSELLLDFPIIDDLYHVNPVQIVASYNGILCLQQGRRVSLWNPATKHCTNLPPLPVFTSYCSTGFGFDAKADDYKLVTINFIDNGDYLLHIYSLRSDCWRKLDGFQPQGHLSSGIKSPFRDKIYCWMDLGASRSFYTFDFTDEVFGNIPSPVGIHPSNPFILMENIAFLAKVNDDYEIWMLSDYEVKESWTKLYSIDPIFEYYPRCMTWSSNNGDFLLFRQGERLFLYDLVTRGVVNLPVHATSNSFEVVMYRESMLSIKRGNAAANGVTSMDCNTRMLINQSMTGNSSWGDSDIHKAAVFHILLWLPVVSLQRFKSVSKSWHSLIKSSDFVAKHLFLHHHQHKIDKFNFILHSFDLINYALFEDSSHHTPNTSGTCLLSADKLELLDLPVCENWGYGVLYIATSLNGIICLKHSELRDIYLWNPATKQFRVIVPEWFSCEAGINPRIRFGFGFDVKTNNYKLVRFFEGVESTAQVYSLSTDSWRTINHEILLTLDYIHSGLDCIHSRQGAYRNEIYCWLAGIADIANSCTIVSFDFSNEVFGTMPLPDSINKSSLSLVLTVLRDKIVCISLGERYSDDMDNRHFEIWMMDEYGVKESWVKQYTVGPFSNDLDFKMYYSKKNEDCIMLSNDGQLYEYDLFTQKTERLPCQIQGPKRYQVVAYEESLVPIKRGYC